MEKQHMIEVCPFCGHVGLDFGDGSTYRWGLASCSGCGATCGEVRREYPDQGKWHEDAINEWNTRAKREWAGLDHDEVVERANQEQYAAAFARGVVWAEAKLKEKNT